MTAALAAVALAAPSMGDPAAGVGPPEVVHDSATLTARSVVAGPTNTLAAADLDGDGDTDLVHLTNHGVQIFRNDGTRAGALRLVLAQEWSAPFAYGGGLIDIDRDGDLDFVFADVVRIGVATNDGRGRFHVAYPFRHGFAAPSFAIPFHRFTNPEAAGNAVLVALGVASDTVTHDRVRSNAGREPFLYVLEWTGTTFRFVQRLDPVNGDGAAAGDVDGDGDTDIVVTDRVAGGAPPVRVYRSNSTGRAAGAPEFALDENADASALGYGFAFAPTVLPGGDVAFGSWHRAAVLPRASAAWGAPESFGLGDHPPAECTGVAHADFDGDGTEDLVTVGRSAPIEIFGRGPAALRFESAALAGESLDVVVADFDGDGASAPDVVVGGTRGLTLLRNLRNGAPASDTPGDTAFSDLARADASIDALLAAHGPSALTEPARAAVEAARDALARIDRDPLVRPGDDVSGPPPRPSYLRTAFGRLQHAVSALATARANSSGDTAAAIDAVQDDVTAAAADLAHQALAQDEGVAPASPGSRDAPSRRLLKRALFDRDAARQLLARAADSERATARASLRLAAVRAAARSAERLAQSRAARR